MLSIVAASLSSVPPIVNILVEPPRPVFAESFSVSTVEVDDTLNGSISVQQVLYRDSEARRSWMSAVGPLVGGANEQIMRCDIQPMGWLVIAGGPDASDPESWTCSNQTIQSDPEHCSWGLFWPPLPTNATYSGKEPMDGRLSNRWDYWQGGEQYALWATAVPPIVPVATGKTWTATAGHHLWRILWHDFKPEAPPLSAFAPTTGVQCPPATVALERSSGKLTAGSMARQHQEQRAPVERGYLPVWL
mmetsp:Transcript_27560/g.70207  ORF Transcript_27560/g.70207 Transcript_27560/m.70207 type:complete len:247 (-) Transcript_27560:1873-2613(-)|eukprot:CAMPEP_0115854956 /NCGR_PEP_ID=MMETSP0287-20121206/14295_1 /TAXON_ID=412157 /ORGANISM="Chrysochromulina rotalis, Strain UIO044" /LENGTH=246 /DNA_ID=CAMNT_0003309097 /DNA_START=271 /DNA_END=1011 /DNA_ORIENTATION=+